MSAPENSEDASDARVVLASGSPRRQELLRAIGLEPMVVVPEVDETPRPGEPPSRLVLRLARSKARSVESHAGPVLAGDTVVADGDRILGKPRDRDDAQRMLTSIAGREVAVHTGLAVVDGDDAAEIGVVTRLLMHVADATRIAAYLATGEGDDKAGALAVQGAGTALVARIDGCWSNVLGLPLCAAVSLLRTVALAGLGIGPTRGTCPGSACRPDRWRQASTDDAAELSDDRSTTERHVRQSSRSGLA